MQIDLDAAVERIWEAADETRAECTIPMYLDEDRIVFLRGVCEQKTKQRVRAILKEVLDVR